MSYNIIVTGKKVNQRMPRHKAHISIRVPKPCSENWEAMTPAEKGRFCASCQKMVVDFSVMTDAQIVAVFEKQAGELTCGRFQIAQLERELVVLTPGTALPQLLLAKIAASFLLLQTIVTSAWSQTARPPTHTTPKQRGFQKKAKAKIINGRMFLENTNTPVGGRVIAVSGTNVSAVSDTLGKFKLKLLGSEPDTIILLIDDAPVKTVYLRTISEQEEISVSCPMLPASNSIPITDISDLVMTQGVPVAYIRGPELNIDSARTSGTQYIIDGAGIDSLPKKHKTRWQRMTRIFRRD